VTTPMRRRLPWVVYGLMLALLGLTLTFTVLNGAFELFVSIAILMMLGYGTVGSLIASRVRGNPLGWLMLLIAFGFVFVGLTDEFLTYHAAHPGSSVPFVRLAAWLTNWMFFLVFGPIPLILLLFPEGRVQSPRWRLLPGATIALTTLGVLAVILSPGFVDTDRAKIVNPTGVEALQPFLAPVTWVVGIGLLAASLASVVALILRFRGASGDERQQIRWLAYLAGVAVVLLIGAVASGIGMGANETRVINELLFLAVFVCVGVAFPIAIGISIFKYRLYDLDIVVKKTLVAFVLFGGLSLAAALAGFAVPLLLIGAGGGSGGLVAIGIAIGFALSPLRRRARRFAERVVYGKRATPYEVLSEFAERVGGAYSSDDVLPRMAQLLAQSTGAIETAVWLQVSGKPRRVAHWPLDARAPEEPDPGDPVFTVEHQGDPLGLITLRMPANDPMDPTKERLVRDVASQAGLVLRNVRLIEDLRSSRQRLVAAQDGERRRLERDIHDGAQQQLVALSVQLRLADTMVERDPAKARELLTQLQHRANDTLEDLRDLARGIYPPLLADKGLAAALEAQSRKSALPVTVLAKGLGRLSQDVEAAVYFSCLEALSNTAKYAEATRAEVRLEQTNGVLMFSVADDGRGFDPDAGTTGSGLQGIADRLDAIGGSVHVESTPGGGTTVAGTIRIEDATNPSVGPRPVGQSHRG
jgi:signal transduction histidine kinase